MEKRTTKAGGPTSVRLSPLARRLWEELAEHTGLSLTAVMEQAIRVYAKAEGLPIDRIREELRQQDSGGE